MRACEGTLPTSPMLALALTLVLAAPKVSIGPPPPLIVMIRTDGPPAFVKTQARLHEELTLLLDSFSAQEEQPMKPG